MHDIEIYKGDLFAMKDAMDNAQIHGRFLLGRRIHQAAFNYHMVTRLSNLKSQVINLIVNGGVTPEEAGILFMEILELEIEMMMSQTI